METQLPLLHLCFRAFLNIASLTLGRERGRDQKAEAESQLQGQTHARFLSGTKNIKDSFRKGMNYSQILVLEIHYFLTKIFIIYEGI